MFTEKGWTVVFWVVAILMIVAALGFFGGGDGTISPSECLDVTSC
jgi:hypothetical protein